LRRLLVGDLHAVGVLELLDERVQIERVSLEVLTKPRRFLDPRRIDLELIGQMGADQREHLLAIHCPENVATCSDEPLDSPSAPALRSASASCSAARVRPITSSWTAWAATSIARAKPRRVKRPCATTPTLRRPSMYAPPGPSGSISSRSRRTEGASSRP